MFTGIVSGLGRILQVEPLGPDAVHGRRLTIATPAGYLDDVGLGRALARFGPLESLQDGLAMEFVEVERVGTDLRVRARPLGRADF